MNEITTATTVRLVSYNGYSVYRLPDPIPLPDGWRAEDAGFGEPIGTPTQHPEPLGEPRPGFDPHFAPRRAYHWPPITVYRTPDEAAAARPSHGVTWAVSHPASFPLGGYVAEPWDQKHYPNTPPTPQYDSPGTT